MRVTRSSEQGSVAVMVALSLLVLLAFAAVAIDIGRAVYARNALQIAIDGAMKSAAANVFVQDAHLPKDEIEAKTRELAKSFIAANANFDHSLLTFDLGSADDLKVVYVATDPDHPGTNDEDTITLTLNARVPMAFAKLFVPSIPITVSGMVKRPRQVPVQLVIVADVTSSMSEAFGTTTRIAALRTSASSLISTLMNGKYVRVGIVPFAGFVRLGDTSDFYLDSGTTLTPQVPWLNMGPVPMNYACTRREAEPCSPKTCYRNDGQAYSCSGCSCLAYTATGRQSTWYWDGCVYLRSPPAGTTISLPDSQYVAITNSVTCRSAPITTDLVRKDEANDGTTVKALLQQRIDALAAVPANYAWGTYISGGLIWAWNMMTAETRTVQVNGQGKTVLDDRYPLNRGYTDSEIESLRVRRSMVLITDGANSMYARRTPISGADSLSYLSNPAVESTRSTLKTQTEDDMSAICRGIEAAGITLYVIALQVDDDTEYKEFLKTRCASHGGNGTFFDAASPESLQKAFELIGASFSYNSLKE